MSAATVAQIFGIANGGKVVEISDIIKDFDFSKLDVRSEKSDDFFHCNLAPAFGELTSESIKSMDDHLKVMIAGTNKLIADLDPKDRSWEKVVACFNQNPLMEADGQAINRTDKIIKNSSGAFRVDGLPSQAIVQEVHSWFVGLINDADVLKSTKIDINVLGRIVAETGATVSNFEDFWGKHEFNQQNMVDIGILRCPDIDHPYFKVYRIQLTAWSDCTRVLFVEKNENGITGTFDQCRFKPRESVISGLKEDTRKKAIAQADAMFD